MAGKEIKIPITADARDVIRATDDVEEALDDVADALDDMSRDTKRGADQAERAVDDLADTFDDARKAAKRLGDETDDVGSRGAKGLGKAREAASEVTQEVGQNLGEAVSSIRGDLTDLGQVGQDTLGGLASTLAGAGPAGIVGAAALAAGAVGLGAVTAEIEAQNERVQKLKDYFADAWREAVEGGRDYIDTATVIGEMNSIIFDTDRADEYKRIQEDSNRLGIDKNVLLKAAAGDQDALNVVTDRTSKLVEEQNKLVTDSADIRTKGRGPKEAAAAQELADLQAINDRWQQYGDINEENRQKQADAAAGTTEYLLDLARKTDTAALSVDALGNKMIELPDGTTFYVDAQTGQASLDLSTFQGDADGVIDHLNGEEITLNLATEDALRAAQSAAGSIAGIPDRNASVTLDTSGAEGALSNFINKPRTLTIHAAVSGALAAFGKSVY